MSRLRCDQTPAWRALRQLYDEQGRDFDVRRAFDTDPERFARFSLQAPHIFADLSKNLMDAEVQAQLLALAEQTGLQAHRDAMFQGERVNTTEQRQVMHHLLRTPLTGTAPGWVPDDLQPVLAQVHATLEAMLSYAEAVRSDARIEHV